MIFNMVGSGVGLNFKVLAYSSEETLLAAVPAENTIGIVTEAEITSWVFDSSVPTDAEEGMLWIETGNNVNKFNALKKNSIIICPLSADQYISGAWTSVVAKSYIDGEWVEWALLLFDNGDTYDDITGGWSTVNSNGHLQILDNNSSDQKPYSKGTVPTSKYNTMYVEYNYASVQGSSYSGAEIGISASTSGAYVSSVAFDKSEVGTTKTATLDISSVDTDYYVKTSGYYCTVQITKIWLV